MLNTELRGGNFGVVTAMEFRLFPHGEVYAGMFLFPFKRAAEVLSAWHAWTQTAPEVLGALDSAALAAFPEHVQPGAPLLFAELRHLGGALARRPDGAGAIRGLDGEYLFFSVGPAFDAAMGAAVQRAGGRRARAVRHGERVRQLHRRGDRPGGVLRRAGVRAAAGPARGGRRGRPYGRQPPDPAGLRPAPHSRVVVARRSAPPPASTRRTRGGATVRSATSAP